MKVSQVIEIARQMHYGPMRPEVFMPALVLEISMPEWDELMADESWRTQYRYTSGPHTAVRESELRDTREVVISGLRVRPAPHPRERFDWNALAALRSGY